jgi:hypothetical protein
MNDSTITTWITIGGKFISNKFELVIFSLPEFNLKKQEYSS